MLDKNALSQLQSLKQEIQLSTPHFEGRVRSTGGRFGFVNTDDGQQFFLAPDEMDKVLPGDRIEFRVEPAGEGKEQAIIEKLLSTELNEFFGKYIVRGKGHFVEADHPTLNRWIFVPPAKRMNASDGDLVKAHISQHPFPKGKAQADIDTIIGKPTDIHIEQTFIKAKWQLPTEFDDAVSTQVAELTAKGLDDILSERTDLTHLPFVTIDSAGTRDIDDALYAEARSQGWALWIAIADPAALIQPGTALDHAALQRATSVYFPDQVVPMLPAELSEQLCSLQADQLRPAMAVELRIGEAGEIEQIHIYNATIRSRAKLSYNQVAQLIDGESSDIPAELHGHLVHLDNCARTLATFRKNHCLVMEDRPDFKLITDEQGKVKDIVRLERNQAHRLVEECMLACNRAVAGWLAEKGSGFFIEHAGVRTERQGEVAALLKEHLPLEKKPSLNSLEDYVSLMQQADASNSDLPLRMIISRQLERSNFSLNAKPHMGLGFAHYTTFTSPLRKYNDLLIHRIVKALLTDSNTQLPDESILLNIQHAQSNARMAANQAETWLKLLWLDQQDKELLYDACIVHINSTGFTVRLDNTGIEGMIDRRKAGNGWTFETKTLTHRNEEQRFVLGQTVRVKLADVHPQARVARFMLV